MAPSEPCTEHMHMQCNRICTNERTNARTNEEPWLRKQRQLQVGNAHEKESYSS